MRFQGAAGTDTVVEQRDANFTLKDATLTIGAETDTLILGVEQATLTGGVGVNVLDATGVAPWVPSPSMAVWGVTRFSRRHVSIRTVFQLCATPTWSFPTRRSRSDWRPTRSSGSNGDFGGWCLT